MRRLLAGLLACAAVAVWAVPAHADATRDKQWHLGFLKMAEAWRLSQGEGVTVAVLDSGVDGSHPDLVRNVLPGADFIQPRGGDGRTDPDGHGTAMAGLIAAHGRGDAGIIGIAPKAKVVSVRITEGIKYESNKYTVAGIRWAIQHGAKVISVSITMGDTLDLRAAVKEALAADVVFVAGIGNTTGAPDDHGGFPARYEGVIGVAGVDQNGNRAAISVVDKGSVLAAPATDVWSTGLGGKLSGGPGGTSNSTAIVAGVAALVRSKYPQLSAKQVYNLLANTAIDKGAPGLDPEYGFGIVDPVAALTKGPAAVAAPSVPPSAEPSVLWTPGPEAEDEDTGPSRAVVIIVRIGLVLLLLLFLAGLTTAIVLVARRSRRR